MKKYIWMIGILFSLSYCPFYAQQLLNEECHWLPVFRTPTQTFTHTSADDSSEDWWFDIKRIPQGHPHAGKYLVCGYSTIDDVANYDNNFNDPCISTQVDLNNIFTCEFEMPGVVHGVAAMSTMAIIDIQPTGLPSNNNDWYWYYNLGQARRAIPTSDGGYLTVGFTNNTRNLRAIVANPQMDSGVPSLIPYNPTTQSSANNFSSVACSPSGTKSNAHGFVLKTNAAGVVQWTNLYGLIPFNGTGQDVIGTFSTVNDVIENTEGYIFVGSSNTSPTLSRSMNGFIVQTDFAGKIIFMRQINFGTNALRLNTIKAYTDANGVLSYYVGGEEAQGSDVIFNKQRAFVMKYNSLGFPMWSTPYYLAGTDKNSRIRDLAIRGDGKIYAPVIADCAEGLQYVEGGLCENSFVACLQDNGTNATEAWQRNFGPVQAYDLGYGISVAATSDDGFLVTGTKKYTQVNLPNYNYTPVAGFLDMDDNTPYSQCDYAGSSTLMQDMIHTDAFVSKCKSDGKVEWTTSFDNKSESPGGNPRTTAGYPRSETQLSNWLTANNGVHSLKDFKREECVFGITTSESGKVIVTGTMSANLDDGLTYMIDNTCNLNLDNHVFQAVKKLEGVGTISQAPEYIATNIQTGKIPGNTDPISEFIVKDGADIKLTAGTSIKMRPGTKITNGSSFKAKIDPTHTCTAGPVYSPYQMKVQSGNAEAYTPPQYKPAQNESPLTNVDFNVFPNPFTSVITIVRIGEKGGSIEICNMQGQALYRTQVAESQTIDLSWLSSGTYFVKITGEDFFKVEKILKQ